MRSKPAVEAVIFDCDGTIANTMKAHEAAYERVFKNYGLKFNRMIFHKYAGNGGKTLLSKLLDGQGVNIDLQQVHEDKKKIYEIIADKYITPNMPLLRVLKSRYRDQYRVALASNGSKRSVYKTLSILNLLDLFDVIVTVDDVNYPKPHPEIYIRTAELLGVKPENCIVFEDTVAGLNAAMNAKMRTIKIRIKDRHKHMEGTWN